MPARVDRQSIKGVAFAIAFNPMPSTQTSKSALMRLMPIIPYLLVGLLWYASTSTAQIR
jgi:hypothetical protein